MSLNGPDQKILVGLLTAYMRKLTLFKYFVRLLFFCFVLFFLSEL